MEEWNLSPDLIHLNHAAVGPWPIRTQKAVCQFAEENARQGSLNYLKWMETELTLRKQIKEIIHAKSHEEIALLKNTSEALSVIAYGLNWQPGDNIVISNQEFPSNYIVWESLKPQGVEIRYADLASHESPEDALIAMCDQNTRLISISSVQYSSGLRMDLTKIGTFCQRENILFCIDAIQSIGAEVFDVQKYQADFVVADGHKWMLGPEGLALFYCRADAKEKLNLKQFGWHMVENYLDFDDKNWKPATSARRFECGSPNMLGIHALSASLSLLLELGMPYVEKELRRKVSRLRSGIESSPHFTVHTPQEPSLNSGIISFQSSRHSSESIFEHLKSHRVFCAIRAGRIRLSPHYYTKESQLDLVLNLLAEFRE